ncbi:DNA translocase FtsK [Pandoraea pulmonicola]|uniref:DNA translocase FtsK n=1 Tax=Pandoraea pulmonicola TaxID=93221 RepID=A0AAJ4Z8C9_PANPU|nr:DNA translocase FtsK [Pandoraea pulmonicola]AJC22270.1 hypothetical protein RO07_20425 [Pandoraea pulmonicola]SUA88668.1 DNA translocase FtsK [Pandoraea pulmonicola]
MGFGWFGLSTFWLLALCWPGVRGLLGGEIRLFGPGTLRMLLGVPLTMVSSATLAALTGGDGNTAGGSVGQSLSHGLHVALGGTLAMGVAGFVLLFSLPLVFGTTWWGMFARAKPVDDDDDESPYESRLAAGGRQPVRGLSQMSFDAMHERTAERGERGERFTPTLGQGHHNVGHLAEEPVPRRRGLAAQPRWKLTDEERARLDAMQPPPLATRGAPRAEPTFKHGATARTTGKGASAGRSGAVAVGVAGAASTHAAAGTLKPASGAPLDAASAASADPLHATSIPGAAGYRRPVGMAPAHLRGTIVRSPFRKPQLGLEDVPPRGTAPVPAGSSPAVEAALTSNTAANRPEASPVRTSAPIRGAASWSAMDAASPLTSDATEFSPLDLSTKATPEEAPIVAPSEPSPEMLAAQEAERAAELARVQALAALREEAEALLRDLRVWSSGAAEEAELAAEAPAALASPDVDSNVVDDITVDASAMHAEGNAPPAHDAPVQAKAPSRAEVLDVPPRILIAPPPGQSMGVTRRPFLFADVLASVQVQDPSPADASIANAAESASVAPVEPSFASSSELAADASTPADAETTVGMPTEASSANPVVGAAESPAELPVEVAFAAPVESREADLASHDELSPPAADAFAPPNPMADAGEAASKPHYVLRADGTWARAEPDAVAQTDAPAPASADSESSPAPMSARSGEVPAIPSFASLGASASQGAPFGPSAAAEPRAASFAADAPYALPAPREPVDYDLPSLELLSPATSQDVANVVSDEALAAVGQLIEQRLAEFKVPVTVVGASAGPVITRFEVEPAVGVRGAQVVGLMKDLARALGVTSIRVVETIPGKTCMGLELPNAQRQMIRLSEILTAPAFDTHRSHLALAMGKDITGEPVVADLARAPHLLVAGTTGSGKSVAVNAMILSLLYKATPDDVRLIMIDPKMLELSVYGGIPHLLAPVVTDMKQAAHALNWCVGEMEKRYRLMSALGVRNLAGYNEKIDVARAAGEKVSNPFSLTPDAPEPLDRLPFIVVVIDELADLMMVAGKKIEELIARLAQKARAAGIHLILATQRPSVDVITGLIKANIPTRVAFQVSSKIDSRTILDQMGAESLLGQGDMLFLPPGTGYPQRVHGAFVADDEVHRVVQHWQQYGEPDYDEAILAGDPAEAASGDLFGDSPGDAEADPLYDEAAAFVLNSRRASISAVQRQLRIGYNRAARLIEQMETAGLVSPMGRNGAREVVAPGD